MRDGFDERREMRILCHLNVIFRLNDENMYGTCKNLALHGMFIGFDGDVTKGDRVDVSFVVSDTASSLVEAWGNVAWVNTGPDRDQQMPEGFGVEFSGMTDESKRLIRRFIEQCSS